MKAKTFDTLTSSEDLEAAGFTEKQAKAAVRVISSAIEEKLETKLEKLSTKEDISKLREDTKEDISKLREEMKDIQISLIKWMIGLLGLTIGFLTFIMAAFKFFH